MAYHPLLVVCGGRKICNAWEKNYLWYCSLERVVFGFFRCHISMPFCEVLNNDVLLNVIVDARLFGIVHFDLV